MISCRALHSADRCVLIIGLLLGVSSGPVQAVDESAEKWTIEVPCGRQEPERVIDERTQFTDVTLAAGLTQDHSCKSIAKGKREERQIMVGGLAVGDYDGDGWPDIYLIGGSGGQNLLYRNRGDGSFEERGAQAGVAISGVEGSGALFADYDGDGWRDLLVTAVNDGRPSLFRNRGDGRFEDATVVSGLDKLENSFSASMGDYDRDGDLDLYIAHWLPVQNSGRLWRNEGDGRFNDVTELAGIATAGMNDFTAHFADINNDGWPDLLVAADYETSQVFANQQDGSFANITTPAISDENGMGASVGDYDNDGDLDWFVTSISGGGISGNRLYRNRGDGRFDDVTEKAGVREGRWGWASCLADFNNDGYLDIFHVNGFGRPARNYRGENSHDASVLFLSQGKRWFGGIHFREQAKALGIDDTLQGRGVACFDYDRDGDLDILIANNNQRPRLYRNNGVAGRHFLNVRLQGKAPNTEAVGARIYVKAAGKTQMRELQAGSNYLSQNLVEAHFGLDDAEQVMELRVVWPTQQITVMHDVPANQFLVIKEDAQN